MNDTGDLTLTCRDCNVGFLWTQSEQRWMAERGYQRPKRCRTCRLERREQREQQAMQKEQ